MTTPAWKRLGFLTPDAYDSQREIWALLACLRAALADVLEALGARTAEPSWAAVLGDGARRSRALADELLHEAGADASASVGDDAAVRELLGALGEVVASGHVPSLIAVGFATLGELGNAPVRLLDEVAGPHVRLLAGRLLSADDHAVLARLLSIAHPGPAEREALRRLLRHVDGLLASVFQQWRQTLHAVGVDGEWLAEEARATARAARQALGLKVSPADLRALG